VGAFLILIAWLALIAVALAWWSRRPGLLPRALAAVTLGAGLASFFLIPCVAHLGSTKADLLRSDFLAYDRHFVEPAQLLGTG
jgi:hypothetical protein